MTLFAELFEADQWLYTTLAGDATIAAAVGTRIYSWQAPPLTSGPYIVYQEQSPGNDIRASGRVGTGRIMTTPLYLVRVIGPFNSLSTLQSIALRIDQLLEGITTATVNGNHISIQRESPFSLVEQDGVQQTYRHLGGMYRFYISGA